MKIQLDTTNKTIKLENDVLLSELIEILEKLLPKGIWKEFKLETNVTINNWSSPIIIEKYTKPTYPHYPWYCYSTAQNDNKMLCGTDLKSGTYNLEV